MYVNRLILSGEQSSLEPVISAVRLKGNLNSIIQFFCGMIFLTIQDALILYTISYLLYEIDTITITITLTQKNRD